MPSRLPLRACKKPSMHATRAAYCLHPFLWEATELTAVALVPAGSYPERLESEAKGRRRPALAHTHTHALHPSPMVRVQL